MKLCEYDLEGIRSVVVELGVKKLALQFPDSLLEDAWEVVAGLTGICGTTGEVEVYVLGDTSYGECCVDEVAAEHVGAELVVHFGHSCLSPTGRLPVKIVPPKSPVQVDILQLEKTVEKLAATGKKVLIVPELCYLEQLRCGVQSAIVTEPYVDVRKVVMPGGLRRQQIGFGRYNIPPSEQLQNEERVFLWVGSAESPTLRNASIGIGTGSVLIFDPAIDNEEAEAKETTFTRVLARRFAMVEKVRDAERIGIIAGTLAVSGQMEVIEQCKRAVSAAGRRHYLICVGKPTPEKLGNFPEIDAFVLVACPESSLLEPRDHIKPIVTPLELLVALSGEYLNPKEYSTDFTTALLRKVEIHDHEEPSEGRGDETTTSLTTRGDWAVQSVRGAGSAAEFLARRSWQGLEYRREGGTLAPTKAVQGRQGIASGYREEKYAEHQSTDW